MAPHLNDLSTEALKRLLDGLPLLSRAFWGPDRAWCEEMRLAAASGELDQLGKLANKQEAARTLSIYLKGFKNSEHLCDTLEGIYVRLFISAESGITASLHQSAYESDGGQLMGRSARMMASRLAALALSLPEEGNVPEDHLAVEIEYLALLLEEGLGKGREDYLKTARDFAEREMKPFLAQFRSRLETDAKSPFYAAMADLLSGLVTLISG